MISNQKFQLAMASVVILWALVPGPSARALQGNAPTGSTGLTASPSSLTLSTGQSRQVVLTAKDAAGISASVSSKCASLTTLSQKPTVTNGMKIAVFTITGAAPGECTVTFQGNPGETTTIAVTVPSPTSGGGPALYVANSQGYLYGYGATGPGNIQVLGQPISGAGPQSTVADGVQSPYAIAFQPNTGNMFVASKYVDAIEVYAPPYNGSPLYAFSGGDPGTPGSSHGEADGVAFDSAGNLYVSNYAESCACGGNVTVFQASSLGPGATPTYSIYRGGAPRPLAVALDAAGNLYVSQDNNAGYGGGVAVYPADLLAIGLATANGASVIASATIPNTQATGITFDSVGRLLVAQSNGYLAVYSSPFSSSSTPAFTVPIPQGSAYGVAVDSLGNTYVSTFYGGTVDAFGPSAQLSATSTPTATLTSGFSGFEPAGMATH